MPPTITHTPTFEQFQSLAAALPANIGHAIPVFRTLLADHLTPVTAFERLSKNAANSQHAFLLESVVGGERIARYSFVAFNPRTIIKAYGNQVTIEHPQNPALATQHFTSPDPLKELEKLLAPIHGVKLPSPAILPAFVGGAVGYAAYDSVRYLEPEKLTHIPNDDRHLPDLLFGLYDDLVIFDNVQKTVLVLANAHIRTRSVSEGPQSFRQIYDNALTRIQSIVTALEQPLPASLSSIDLTREDRPAYTANMTQAAYEKNVLAAKEYIKSGDIFQVVLSQRLCATTPARPFDIYRALRVINPSPFMFYLANPECTLVGSSPEIMCRVQDGIITNRPLAGTRRRGKTESEDQALEADLLADPKERAEHIMLVDLGRNDVGRAAEIGSVKVSDCMTVEKYSHVMHIVSNVSGKLAEGKTVFDALRLALPVGTVSGAPKIRAMQIIDELEPTKRGPYAGAVGYIDYNRNVDTAIALRTMVITPHIAPGLPGVTVPLQYIAPGLPGVTVPLQYIAPGLPGVTVPPQYIAPGLPGVTVPPQYIAPGLPGVTVPLQYIAPGLPGVTVPLQYIAPGLPGVTPPTTILPPPKWNIYVQAGAGIVADSVPASEYQECLNKASALLKAVALAEQGLA